MVGGGSSMHDLFINGIELNFAFGGDLHHLPTQTLLALVIGLRIAEWPTRFELCPATS